MAKALPVFVAGLIVGGGIVWAGLINTRGNVPVAPAPVQVVACDARELEAARTRLSLLEQELQQQQGHAFQETRHNGLIPHKPDAAPSIADEDPQAVNDDATRWRISAIEKFVPLSEGQKARLRTKYAAERFAKQKGEEVESESLEQILGAEGATYYRQQVKASFDRAKSEEVEREVVWLARKLALSQQQEDSVRNVLAEVEAASENSSHGVPSGTPQDRLRAMIEDNRRKAEKRNELLRQILTPDQYQAYLAGESESAFADMEVFHDPGK
jgi:hypothetical protein